MAIPTTAEARLFAAAYKKAATWGTEVAVAVGDELLVLSDGDLATARKQDMLQLKESNNTFLRTIVAGAVTACDFSPELYMRYEMGALGTILAQLFGTAGTPAAATDLHTHTFQWATSTTGQFGTYVAEYPGKAFSVPSAKPYKFVISLQDGILKATPTLRGNVVIDDSAVNGATQTDALVGTDQGSLVKFAENTKCWLALASHADAMASTEAVAISGFELTYQRGLETPKTANGATYLSEPGEEDYSEIRVKLDFPKNDTSNDMFFDDFQDGTAWQLILEFTGPHGGSTSQHMVFSFFFPKLLVAAVPDTKKAGMVKTSVEFIAVTSADALPVGMTTYHVPYIQITNDKSADYLA
jgi:hypothetical protein